MGNIVVAAAVMTAWTAATISRNPTQMKIGLQVTVPLRALMIMYINPVRNSHSNTNWNSACCRTVIMRPVLLIWLKVLYSPRKNSPVKRNVTLESLA